VALAFAEPPLPKQVNVKVVVALSAALASVPEMALAPDQPPDAEHEVALVLLQVNVTVCPAPIVVGLALSTTFGGGLLDGPLGLPPLPPPPPQPASTTTPARAANERVKRKYSCGIFSSYLEADPTSVIATTGARGTSSPARHAITAPEL
jgi:hypothetical protein